MKHVSGLESVIHSQAKQLFTNLDVLDSTRKEYIYRINSFLNFLQQNGFHKNSYLDYKRFLQGRTDLGISSKNKYLIVARVYCRELHRQGMLPVDITQGIKSFQQLRKHKKEGLTEEEIDKLVSYLNKCEVFPTNTRVKAIIALLILQGLRQIEIVRLDVSDIDLASGRMCIQGKGRDDKEAIDLHPQTVKALKDYLKINRIADGALFISTSNNSKSQRLTTKSVRNLINPILRELGIDKTVHGFRHYFVTKLVKEYRGDLLQVIRYTRHRSVEMLQVYNDSIKTKEDLPRYYETFREINFTYSK